MLFGRDLSIWNNFHLKNFLTMCNFIVFLIIENLCLRNNGDCDQHCQFNRGVKTCLCKAGFTLQADGKTCKGKCFWLNCVVAIVTFSVNNRELNNYMYLT